MAKHQIKVDEYVKLTVNTQSVFGKVTKVEEGNATIVLPTGVDFTFEVEKASFEAIKEEEYKDAVRALLNQLAKSLDIDINGIMEKSKNLEAKNQELETKASEIQKKLDEASQKLADIEAEKVAAERLEQLKAVEGIDLVDEDQLKASAAIKVMSVEQFNNVLKMAQKAFQKLTDQRKTSLPALTDQTKTGQTKLTEAEVKAEEERKAKEAAEALAKAEAEKQESLNNAGATNEPENALATLMEKRFEKRKNRNKAK